MTFLEVPVGGDEHRFVERTIRIAAAGPGVGRRGRRFWPRSPLATGA
jgi:hypothetical protein